MFKLVFVSRLSRRPFDALGIDSERLGLRICTGLCRVNPRHTHVMLEPSFGLVECFAMGSPHAGLGERESHVSRIEGALFPNCTVHVHGFTLLFPTMFRCFGFCAYIFSHISASRFRALLFDVFVIVICYENWFFGSSYLSYTFVATHMLIIVIKERSPRSISLSCMGPSVFEALAGVQEVGIRSGGDCLRSGRDIVLGVGLACREPAGGSMGRVNGTCTSEPSAVYWRTVPGPGGPHPGMLYLLDPVCLSSVFRRFRSCRDSCLCTFVAFHDHNYGYDYCDFFQVSFPTLRTFTVLGFTTYDVLRPRFLDLGRGCELQTFPDHCRHDDSGIFYSVVR